MKPRVSTVLVFPVCMCTAATWSTSFRFAQAVASRCRLSTFVSSRPRSRHGQRQRRFGSTRFDPCISTTGISTAPTQFSSTTLWSTHTEDEDGVKVLPEWCHYQPRTPLVLPLPRDSRVDSTAGATQPTTNARPILSVVAPMVAASDYAFRCLTRQYHADLTFTQMMHARNLVHDDTFYRHHWDLYEYAEGDTNCPSESDIPRPSRPAWLPAQRHLLQGLDERAWQAPDATATRGPVVAQLAGHRVDEVVPAALKLLASTRDTLAGIDFNLGCPQGIARKGHYGAFLMEQDEERVYQILSALRRTLPSHVAVSAKIRLPLDPSRQVDRLRRLCDTGIDFVTIHGRDWTENKSTVSAVHLDRLAAAVDTVRHATNIPVIVNGGIETGTDIDRILHYTQASAVMSSEALLERPWLFQRRPVTLSTPRARFQQQMDTAATYLEWCRYAPPVPGVLGIQGGSFNVVRGHLFNMLYPYLNEHLDLRDDLANNFTFQQLAQALQLVQTLRDRYAPLLDAAWEVLPSSRHPESSWYRRHWSASQSQPAPLLSVDERKEATRLRIAQLREKRSAVANR